MKIISRFFTQIITIIIILVIGLHFILQPVFDSLARKCPVIPSFSDWSSVRQVEIDYWRTINVNTMTPQQIVDYFHWSNRSSCKLTHDFGGFMVTNIKFKIVIIFLINLLRE